LIARGKERIFAYSVSCSFIMADPDFLTKVALSNCEYFKDIRIKYSIFENYMAGNQRITIRESGTINQRSQLQSTIITFDNDLVFQDN
jgi:hypothetical protein